MRTELAKYENKKVELIATIGRNGIKPGYSNGKFGSVLSLLLTDIYDTDDNYISDHVWVKNAKCFIRYKEGDVIRFRATVKRYMRSNRTMDYGLVYPNHKVYLVN